MQVNCVYDAATSSLLRSCTWPAAQGCLQCMLHTARMTCSQKGTSILKQMFPSHDCPVYPSNTKALHDDLGYFMLLLLF